MCIVVVAIHNACVRVEQNASTPMKAQKAHLVRSSKHEKKSGKVARGRYKCSLCGELKTNHICALVPDKLMCTVGTQSCAGRSIVITPRTRQAVLGVPVADSGGGSTIHGFSSSSGSSSSCLSSRSCLTSALGLLSADSTNTDFGSFSSSSFDFSAPPPISTGGGMGLSNLSIAPGRSWSFGSSAAPTPKAINHDARSTEGSGTRSAPKFQGKGHLNTVLVEG
jgi:hypothetical protein